MRRGKTQAIYKFLPEMWVAYKDDSNITLTAKMNNWNYVKIENLYNRFLEHEIRRQIRMFGAKGGDINAFSIDSENDCFAIVEPACNEGIPDIIGELSPLVFYCSNCHATFKLRKPSEISRSTWICKQCNQHSIKQLQMVYACECGYAQPIEIPYVPGNPKLEYYPNETAYKMFYREGKNRKAAEFNKKCPNCGNYMYPDNAESGRNYKPFSVSIINLVDKKSGDFYDKGLEAKKIVIAKWFNQLSQNEYKEIINNLELSFSQEMRSDAQREEAERQIQSLIDANMIPAAMFDSAVANLLASKQSGSKVDQYIQKCDQIYDRKSGETDEAFEERLNHLAFTLMQYDTVKYSNKVITLNDSIQRQQDYGFISNESEILSLHDKLGIKNMQVSCDIEIINCTYGYTRKSVNPANTKNKNCRLKLNAFDKTKDGNENIAFGAKLETEGILFEIDRVKILKWLLINNIITETQMPDLDDEISVKKWFAENVSGEAVSAFDGVDEGDLITKNVFELLHSISHAFMKTTGELSGLAVNSLTEKIFVETASIFIYAQTSQGIPLGALSGMAESKYVFFLRNTLEDNRNCIFDPICTERDDSACNACLHLPETSCSHFNYGLGRKNLYTLEKINGDDTIIGFWEM